MAVRTSTSRLARNNTPQIHDRGLSTGITDVNAAVGLPLTTAILDRLTHRRALVKFHGRRYRLKEAAARLVNATPAA
jgi:hypothetical protein